MAWLLSQSWSKFGSLGGQFTTYLEPEASEIGGALDRLVQDWKKKSKKFETAGLFFLLNTPVDGSCCKRWCLFLRWMGRKDQLDPGLWTQKGNLSSTLPKNRALKSSQLVMPLDTHTGRISQYLGLTSRKTLNWTAAREITDFLKKIDPEDPTRYDFSLSRLGILDICQRKYREEICNKCQLLPACRFARSRSAS
jgi:uncharacterized protein (TIGR02757 family)